MGQTSIPCSEETAELLRQDKNQRGMGWDEYLQTIAGERSDNLGEKVRRLENRVDDLEAKMSRY